MADIKGSLNGIFALPNEASHPMLQNLSARTDRR